MIIVLTGTDTKAIDQRIHNLTKPYRDEWFEVNYSLHQNFQDAVNAARQLVFLGRGKIAVFEGKLEAIDGSELAAIPENNLLILHPETCDSPRKIPKSLKKMAAIETYNVPEWWETDKIQNLIAAAAKSHNLSLPAASVSLLQKRVGRDTYRLNQELEKISILGDCSPRAIADLTDNTESSGFDLACVIVENKPHGISLLEHCLSLSEPLEITGALIYKFRELYLSLAAPQQLKMKPTRIYYIQKEAQKVGLSRLARIYGELFRCHQNLKRGQGNITETIARVLMIRQSPPKEVKLGKLSPPKLQPLFQYKPPSKSQNQPPEFGQVKKLKRQASPVSKTLTQIPDKISPVSQTSTQIPDKNSPVSQSLTQVKNQVPPAHHTPTEVKGHPFTALKRRYLRMTRFPPQVDLERVTQTGAKIQGKKEAKFIYITNSEQLDKYLKFLTRVEALGIDTETTGLNPHTDSIRLLQLAAPNSPTLIIDFFKFPVNSAILLEIIQKPDVVKIAHNWKFDWQFLTRAGYQPKYNLFCTQLAEELLTAGVRVPQKKWKKKSKTLDNRGQCLFEVSPYQSNPDEEETWDKPPVSLKEVAQKYLGVELNKTERLTDWNLTQLTPSQLEYAAEDASVLLPLREKLNKELEKSGLTRAAHIEFYAVSAVAEIEYNGMKIDPNHWGIFIDKLKVYRQSVAEQLHRVLKPENHGQLTLFPELETPINLSSPSQLKEALNRLGITVHSTNVKALKPWAEKFPIIGQVLEYKKLDKAVNAFGDKLLGKIHPVTGRIHPNYKQLGADSGRSSCQNPNLQQIPSRGELGQTFRRGFVPEPGYKYVIADYSQIELRIAAEVSGDPTMIAAYVEGRDLHIQTAAMVLEKPESEITKDERLLAKAVNFGLIYGQKPPGFKVYAETTYGVKISLEQSEKFRHRYLAQYSGIKTWHRRIEKDFYAKKDKKQPIYTRTLTGRRRFFPNDKAYLNPLANTPVQGTGADILKLALGQLQPKLEGTGAKIIGAIHDEIILEVPEANAETAAKILQETMESAGNQILKKVPVIAEVGIGESWADKA